MDSVGRQRDVQVAAQSPGAQRATRFSTGDRAHLVLFHGRTTRLAWSITYRASSTAWYAAVVDATSGAVLRRANLVDHAAPVTVFENYPGAPRGGTQQARDLEALGYVGPGATTLTGPFARTYLDVDDSNDADPSEEVAPGIYPFQDFTATVGADGFCTPAKQCAWNPGRARLVAGQPRGGGGPGPLLREQVPRSPGRRPHRVLGRRRRVRRGSTASRSTRTTAPTPRVTGARISSTSTTPTWRPRPTGSRR